MSEEAFVHEVEHSERMLYRISCTMLDNQADCCDAVQEALLKAWQHKDGIEPKYFRTYLTRILINECRNIGRRRARVTVVDKMPEQIAPEPPDPALRDALFRLKPQQRLVLTLYYLEGFNLGEIARMLKVPLGTVKWRISLARKALRGQWTIQTREGGTH